MKKVKGIVLESTKKKLILLTCEGEYRSLPARGKLYPPGAEVEIAPAMLPANLPVFAAAAAVLLVMAFTLLWHTAVTRPAAYLALDINPSILLLLDSDASVISTEALNNEGEILGKELELKGELAVTALELILQEAGSRGYLAGERDNMVLLALAAPSDYVLGDALLRQSASQQLLSLKVDSYLKISTTTPEAAQEAMQKEVSLNAVLLAEELAVKGLLPLQDKNDEDEQEKTAAAKAEINVQKLLEQVLPQHVFTEKEFVRGDVSGRPGPPVTPPGQDKKPMN